MPTPLTAGVRGQLRFAFALVIALSFFSTALAIWRLQMLADDTKALTHRPLAKERLVSSWLLGEALQQPKRGAELQKQVGEMLDTPEEKAMFEQIGQAGQAPAGARERILAQLGELLALQQKTIDSRAGGMLADARHGAGVLVAVCLATLVFNVAAGALLARALFRRLGGEPALAAAVASEIAAGNLRVEVPLADGDQASLMAGLKRMRDSLAGIVGQVRHGTAAIGESIAVMSREAQELSRRTEGQAASLEETASSIEELTQGIQHSADNAEQANELAAQASRVAQQGGAMVGQLVDTMGAINESSSRIADIIGVIDGIAFQTNILALNAAVEAARAGEQGRGFAVVAGEVRALAQRSAAAAKEIKTLIDDSTGRVAEGSALAGKAGQTMQGIVASIDRVSVIMNDIVASSREQASGIAQVNQAITRMDSGTQQNAALVEETAAATRAMEEQSGKLQQLVALFQVEAAAAPAAAARPSLPAVKPAPAPARPAQARAARKSAPARPAAVAEDWEEF